MPEREVCGVLPFIKKKGMTSLDAVNIIRRLYCTKKVGHTGTLDPMASGVMLMLIGRATRANEYIVTDRKSYRAELKLGAEYDSGDVSGNIIESTSFIPDEKTVIAAASEMTGRSIQIPPMYSALKVNGERLYKIARRGETVEREGREIELFSIDCKPLSFDTYILEVECSSGTYIRTLCEDIAKKAGTLGAMSSLERTSVGSFKTENCLREEELAKMSGEERREKLISVETLFEKLPKIALGDFHSHLISNGCNVLAKKLKSEIPPGNYVSLYDKDGFIGIGISSFGNKEREEDPEKIYIKKVKSLR